MEPKVVNSATKLVTLPNQDCFGGKKILSSSLIIRYGNKLNSYGKELNSYSKDLNTCSYGSKLNSYGNISLIVTVTE